MAHYAKVPLAKVVRGARVRTFLDALTERRELDRRITRESDLPRRYSMAARMDEITRHVFAWEEDGDYSTTPNVEA